MPHNILLKKIYIYKNIHKIFCAANEVTHLLIIYFIFFSFYFLSLQNSTGCINHPYLDSKSCWLFLYAGSPSYKCLLVFSVSYISLQGCPQVWCSDQKSPTGPAAPALSRPKRVQENRGEPTRGQERPVESWRPRGGKDVKGKVCKQL